MGVNIVEELPKFERQQGLVSCFNTATAITTKVTSDGAIHRPRLQGTTRFFLGGAFIDGR